MKREPWIGRNAFWILSLACGGMAFFADYREREGFASIFLLITLVCVMLGIYYYAAPKFQSLEEVYEKAVRHQKRRKGIKVIRGGKR